MSLRSTYQFLQAPGWHRVQGVPWAIPGKMNLIFRKKVTPVAEMSSSNAIVKHCQGHTFCHSGSYIEQIHMLS